MSKQNALFWLAVLAASALAAGVAGLGGARGGGPAGTAAGPGDVAAGRAPAGERNGQLTARAGASIQVNVTRVVDGDTIHVQDASGAGDTVRYIGIDTPESVKPNTPVQCYAKAAGHRNEELVAGQAVRLVLGAEPRDKYHRLLAYVYGGGGVFVNQTLVSEGFARTLTIPPNDRYAARFAALADTARAARTGLWGSC
jgi:micrococcal nuclease